MTFANPFLHRNRLFAQAGAFKEMLVSPSRHVCVITCLDPRTDPSAFLDLRPGEAIVFRNAGGRVNQALLDDLAFITYLADRKLQPGDGPLFEVVVIHHTDCGTRALADPEFRNEFAAHAAVDEAALQWEAVVDPASTVRSDVNALLHSNALSRRITASGHVYDLATGLVTTIVPAAPMPGSLGNERATE